MSQNARTHCHAVKAFFRAATGTSWFLTYSSQNLGNSSSTKGPKSDTHTSWSISSHKNRSLQDTHQRFACSPSTQSSVALNLFVARSAPHRRSRLVTVQNVRLYCLQVAGPAHKTWVVRWTSQGYHTYLLTQRYYSCGEEGDKICQRRRLSMTQISCSINQ